MLSQFSKLFTFSILKLQTLKMPIKINIYVQTKTIATKWNKKCVIYTLYKTKQKRNNRYQNNI